MSKLQVVYLRDAVSFRIKDIAYLDPETQNTIMLRGLKMKHGMTWSVTNDSLCYTTTSATTFRRLIANQSRHHVSLLGEG